MIDIYVNPIGEDLGTVASGIRTVLGTTTLPGGVKADIRGMVQGMEASFRSFALGLLLALVLLYLILVAQFRSFTDPLLILLAVPPGLSGVLAALYLTNTTLNVQSLMGVLMMVGMAVSNSILIVEFTHRLQARRPVGRRRRGQFVPDPAAPDPDDLARDHHRTRADGVEARDRQRSLCARWRGRLSAA